MKDAEDLSAEIKAILALDEFRRREALVRLAKGKRQTSLVRNKGF